VHCAGSGVKESTPAGVSIFQQDQVLIFWIGTGTGAGVIFKHSGLKILSVFALYVNCDRSQTGAGVDKFLVIRSHIRSRSQCLKHRSGVGVEKSDSAHL